MRMRSRVGFTLVELLTAVAIIALLVQLLLPAVQSAREAARQTACSNNLKQLGIGFFLHEDAIGTLPTGGWTGEWVGDPNAGFGRSQPGGWIHNILPFIEQQSLYDYGKSVSDTEKVVRLKERDAMTLDFVNCPSRRSAGPHPNFYRTKYEVANGYRDVERQARADYAANVGDTPYVDVKDGPTSIEEAERSTQHLEIAAFNGISFTASQVRMAQIIDGTSKTYMLGERYCNPSNYTTGESYGDDWSMYTGHQNDIARSTFIEWPPLRDTPDTEEIGRFGSAHPQTCTFAFCDGSVRSVEFQISPEVHRGNGNRKDSQQ